MTETVLTSALVAAAVSGAFNLLAVMATNRAVDRRARLERMRDTRRNRSNVTDPAVWDLDGVSSDARYGRGSGHTRCVAMAPPSWATHTPQQQTEDSK